jgi:hypothetical protein
MRALFSIFRSKNKGREIQNPTAFKIGNKKTVGPLVVPTVFKILCYTRLFRRAHPQIGVMPPPVAQSVFKRIFDSIIHNPAL